MSRARDAADIPAELTATTTELNILDGVTATATELNILDGVTATAAELNKLDGVTVSATEINYLSGLTSSIQTQLSTAAITSGTIDGVTIGGTTPAAGSFTTLDTTGNVGIGTSSFDTVNGGVTLQLESSTAAEVIIKNSDPSIIDNQFLGAYLFANDDGAGSPPHYQGMACWSDNTTGSGQLEWYIGRISYEAGVDSGNMILNSTGLGIGVTPDVDLSLASGGVIGWDSSDVTITHSANALSFAGASSGYSFGGGDINITAQAAGINFTAGTGQNLITGQQGITIDIDNENDQTAQSFIVSHDGQTETLLQVSEDGNVEIPNGNLGIGTTASATNVLTIEGASPICFFSDTNTTSGVRFKTGTLSGPTTNAFRFQNSSGTVLLAMRENANVEVANGNFGIGTTPSYTLHTVTSSTTLGNVFNCNAITTGIGVQVSVNNASFSGNALYSLVSDSSSTGRAGYFRNDGTGDGILIDQNGNGRGLFIDSEATTASGVLNVNCETLTTGRAVQIYNNSASFSGELLYINAENASGTGNAIEVKNDGTGDGVFIDSNNAGAIALNIDHEGTTANAATINADALTTGSGLKVASNSASFSSTLGLLNLVVNDPSATGRGVYLQNDGTGTTVYIDHNNATGYGLHINGDQTTSYPQYIQADSLTTGSGLYVKADNATFSGNVGYFYSANASSSGIGLRVRQDGTGTGMLIDQNGNGLALNVAADNTTSDVVQIIASAATTGRGFYLYSNSGSFTSSNGFFNVVLDHASASGNAARFKNDGTGYGVFIDQNGNSSALVIDSEATSGTGVDMSFDAKTSGANLTVRSNSATYASYNIYSLIQNASASGSAGFFQNNGTGNTVVIDNNGSGNALYTDGGDVEIANGELRVLGTGGSSTNSLDFNYNGVTGVATMQADSSGGSTSLAFGTSLSGTVSERMRIDYNGNVGIGTNNPSVKLHVSGGRTYLTGNNEAFNLYMQYSSGYSGMFIGGNSSGAFQISSAGGATAATVNSSGDLSTNGSVSDEYGNVRSVPYAGAKSTAYTLQASDAGRFIQVNSGGSITIPNNTFSQGDVVTITTGGNTATITCNTSFSFITGDTTNVASVTLATRGICTLLFSSGTLVLMSGNIS